MLRSDYKALIDIEENYNSIDVDNIASIKNDYETIKNNNNSLNMENHQLKEQLKKSKSLNEELSNKYNKLIDDYKDLENDLSDEKEIAKNNVKDLNEIINKIKNDKQLLEKDIEMYEMAYKGFYDRLLLKFNKAVNDELNNTSFINRVFGRFNVFIDDNNFEKIDNIKDEIKRID